MKIYIGADHRGFKLKEQLQEWLIEKGYDSADMGAYELMPGDDYTLYAEKVGAMVREDAHARGILLCGSGVGVDIAVNKLDGIRASIGMSPKQVAAGRADDDMNVLVLAADFVELPHAQQLVEAFLTTDFDNKERHKRRLAEITALEENN